MFIDLAEFVTPDTTFDTLLPRRFECMIGKPVSPTIVTLGAFGSPEEILGLPLIVNRCGL